MSRLSLAAAFVSLCSLSACAASGEAADTLGDAAAEATGVMVDGADSIANYATYAYGEAVTELGAARIPDGARVAVAEIRTPGDTTSGVTGEVVMIQTTDGIAVRYDVRGLGAGEHGFHVHEGASCDAAMVNGRMTPGGAAGGHLNPMASPHGARTAARTARHAGDFGNITAGEYGRAEGSFTDTVAALSGPTSVVGHAVLVHSGRDDLTSQPSGMAGDRVGCGILELRGTTRN